MIEALCHLCSIPVENYRVEISAPIVPAKLASLGHSNLSYYQPSNSLDKIFSSELWACLALPHVPLQLKCLVQGKDYLQQIILSPTHPKERHVKIWSQQNHSGSVKIIKEPGHR